MPKTTISGLKTIKRTVAHLKETEKKWQIIHNHSSLGIVQAVTRKRKQISWQQKWRKKPASIKQVCDMVLQHKTIDRLKKQVQDWMALEVSIYSKIKIIYMNNIRNFILSSRVKSRFPTDSWQIKDMKTHDECWRFPSTSC